MIRMVRLGELDKDHDLTIEQRQAALELVLREVCHALGMASTTDPVLASYLATSPLKITDGMVLVPVEDGLPA
jgi:hypothetical protein